MDSSYAIWVASTMLCFLVIESLDVVHGQNTDGASLRALIVEWGDKLPTNWGKTSDPCNPEWEGIQCRNSRIIELKLSSTNLEGNLPADIGGLTELKTLDLSYNKGLSGSLTSSIGELTKLETLILQGCNFDGVIPKELGNLAELYYLALNDNKFIGEMPAEMSKLGKLYWFDITNNKLSGKLPSWLQNLTKAKHFHFGQNQFTGEIPPEIFHPSMTLIHILFEANKLEGGIPDTIKYMDKLEVLRLDRNGLTGPVPSITNLTRLNELYLSDNKLTGQLPNLTGLISLKTAYLSNNAFIPAEAPSWLTELTSLTTLAIESGGIQGEFPSKLLENSQLETVKLKNNSFNGSLSLTSTSISSKLKVLDLRENEIDDVIVRQGNTLSFSYSVLGSPFCAPTNGSTEACNDLNNTEKGYSTSFTCGIKPCPNNQNLNPRNCECAYAYTGTMELRAPSFSSFTDAERFRSLERSLWEKLDLLNNSVYVEFQNDDPDRSTYNVIKIQLFPSMKISFDRSEISEIGFKLSNQTYKPPPGFSPFTFRGDPYLYFDGVSEKTSNNNIGIIAGIACGCATLVIVIVASIILVVRKKKREGRMNDRSHNFEGWGEEKTKDSGPAPQLKGAKSFSFDDLRKYTNDFSVINEIGSGGYGKVYKGLLPNGILVAIKRAVSGSMQGGIEFKNEIELLSRVHHKNLVSLIGFCFDKNEQILVYEYIPNGTLRESLLGKTGIVLDWKRRLKVALGSARGLAYLHDNADPSIIHRDVKSSNILLNGNLSAKVADFGLSKLMPDVELGHVSTQVKGTIGYVDPEYYMTQHLTEKSDVYSFGVVMMELITGKPPIERGQYIVRQVRQMLNKDDETRGLKYIIDPLIQNTPHLFGFGNFVDLALRCVEEASDNRPNMCEVVREIELILQNNGSNPATGTSLGSDLGAPKDIPRPYNNSMLHRWGNDSSSAAYDSSAGFQMAYTVEPK